MLRYHDLTALRLLNFEWRCMADLERSYAELCATLLLAGKEIRKLNFGHTDSPILALLRRVLRESRAVAPGEGCAVRVRLSRRDQR